MERWSQSLFIETLPRLAQENWIKESGSVWLPHFFHIENMIADNISIIERNFSVEIVSNPFLNPLAHATEVVEDKLLKCKDKVTNKSQLRAIKTAQSVGYFFKLTRKRVADVTLCNLDCNGAIKSDDIEGEKRNPLSEISNIGSKKRLKVRKSHF